MKPYDLYTVNYNTGFFVYYGCSTCKGSSGSSVLKVVDGKLRVVALHCASQEKYLNYGSLFSAVLSHASLIDGNGNHSYVAR